MNHLAIELNNTLRGSVVVRLLSDFGKRFYFPRGIASQAAEARDLAKTYNATIGMACRDGGPMMPAAMEELLSSLSRNEAVEYAPNGGDPALREVWQRELLRKNPSLENTGMSNPMVVAGLTNGIAQVADLFINPGDRVIVPDLYWGNYRLIFLERHGAELTTYPFFDGDLGFNTAGLAECLRGTEKATVILNFPNNPTGYSPTREEAIAIRDILVEAAEAGTSLLVLCDDAYFGLFYEKEIFPHSPFSLLADAHSNILAVKVDGPTKEDFAWGFRIGFVTFGAQGLRADQYNALELKLLGAIRSSISNCSRPAQSLLLQAMGNPEYSTQKQTLLDELERRYRLVKGIVQSMPDQSRLTPMPFNSGYFLSFFFPGKAEALRQTLLRDRGIGTIAIGEDYLRVAYASVDHEVIRPLFEEIFAAAQDL